MPGTINILSGKGHEELVLPEDRIEAKKKVDELIGKGYSIMVTVTNGGQSTEKKVSGYDENTGEYLIKEKTTVQKEGGTSETQEVEVRVASDGSKATAIAPIAGG